MSGFSFLAVLSILLGYCYAGCPSGWATHEGSCYLYHHEKYTFFEAKVTCDLARGHMVEITSESENQFIKNMATSHGDLGVWIGLGDFVVEGEFLWVESNEKAVYTRWAHGEPNDLLHKEDCAYMRQLTGKWVDSNCETHASFVCERVQVFDEIVG